MDYLQKAPRLEPVTYTTMDGEIVETQVLMIPAIVDSVPSGEQAIRTNRNGTEWRLLTVKIKHPINGIQTRNAQLFEKSYMMFPDAFTKGGEIELMVQTTGEGKGLAKAQLQTIEKIDVEAWSHLLNSPIEEQVVDEELVA